MNRRLSSATGTLAAIVATLLFTASGMAAPHSSTRDRRTHSACLAGGHVSSAACSRKLATRRLTATVKAQSAKVKPGSGKPSTKKPGSKGKGTKGSGTGTSGSGSGSSTSGSGSGSSTSGSGSGSGTSGSGSGTSGSDSSGSGSGSSSPVSGGLVVGLAAGAAGWGGASTGPRLDSITSQTGAKWLREEFYWSTVEPQPGVFDWSYYDHYMLEMAQRGLHIVAQLDNTPSWAGTDPSTIPTDPTTFAQFVAAFVGRYGANGTFWTQNPTLSGSAVQVYELYNEPYFNSGNDYNPAAYANLIKAASTAGKAVDPTAKFLIEADMQSAQNAATNWIWWVDALYAAVPNLNNYFDGIAMHDYGDDTTNLNPIIPNQPYPNFGHILRILDLRQQFTNHGAANKPFWIMEAGWSTCTGGDTDCVTDAQQAANLSTMFGYINTSWSSFVQAIFIYSFQDGSNPTQIGDAYGLTTLAGTAKPALAVFQHEETLAGS